MSVTARQFCDNNHEHVSYTVNRRLAMATADGDDMIIVVMNLSYLPSGGLASLDGHEELEAAAENMIRSIVKSSPTPGNKSCRIDGRWFKVRKDDYRYEVVLTVELYHF